MVFLNNEKNGVLPSQYIKELIDRNFIFSNENINEDLIQPASIDLRLVLKPGVSLHHFYLAKIVQLKRS